MQKRLLQFLIILALGTLLCFGLTAFLRKQIPVVDVVPAEPVSAPISAQPARLLSVSVDLEEEKASLLLDGDYRTDLPLPDRVLCVEASEPIAALYLIWGTDPGDWTLKVGEESYPQGENGFLHAFIPLDTPADTLYLYLPKAGTRLCDLFCYSSGMIPASVQQWLPPCEEADLLVFSTHDDDEFVFFGGLLPYYAAVCGKEVQVAYMTTNYYDVEGEDQFRVHEALNGLWFSGIRHYPVTNAQIDVFCESLEEAEEVYGIEPFRVFQVEQIRRFRPLVIVTQDHNGEYGHGAHQLNARSLEWAVYAAADSLMFPELTSQYGVWNTPKTYLHLYGAPEDRTVLDYETPAACFGGLTPYEIAWLAFEKHRSQQKWGFEVYSFDSEYDSHSFGLYRSLVGPDQEKKDLFEHLDSDYIAALRS